MSEIMRCRFSETLTYKVWVENNVIVLILKLKSHKLVEVSKNKLSIKHFSGTILSVHEKRIKILRLV